MRMRLELEREWPHTYQTEPFHTANISNIYFPVEHLPETMPTELLGRNDFYYDQRNGRLYLEVHMRISDGIIFFRSVRSPIIVNESGIALVRDLTGTVEVTQLAHAVWNASTEVGSSRENRLSIRRFSQADHHSGLRAYSGNLILPRPRRV